MIWNNLFLTSYLKVVWWEANNSDLTTTAFNFSVQVKEKHPAKLHFEVQLPTTDYTYTEYEVSELPIAVLFKDHCDYNHAH